MENPAEVQELRNKLRMMKFPQDEILNTVRKQQRAIHKQKQANETIRAEIDEYQRQIDLYDQTVAAHDSNEELIRLKTQEKSLANRLGIINADYQAEDQKRKALEDEVSKARSRVGGAFAASREMEEVNAKIRTMENRLDKALVRYNQNLTALSEKRDQIDQLRKDRFTFRDIIAKSKAESQELSETIQNQIKLSNEYYSQRDGLKMDIQELKETEKADVDNFNKEMDRLNQTIESQKITASRPQEQQQSVPMIISQSGSTMDGTDEITKQTDQYQETINKTLDLLGYQTIEELFDAAQALERENFSLFNYVVEHGATKSKLQDDIAALDLQLETLQEQSQETEHDQATELAMVSHEIEATSKDLAELKDEDSKRQEEFSVLFKDIDELFSMLGCSWENSPDDKTSTTQNNALFALASIETAIVNIMEQISAKARSVYDTEPVETRSSVSLAKQTEPKPQHIDINLDTTLKSIQDVQKPLTLDEIRAKLPFDSSL